ncbi:MAG: ATP-dependent DNA helicase PcrA [candidate division CPR3 bacterium GW2011_GWF2_35_18]|uniref:DNA 3'-5' helicase n=1 Tax=candidate division CPR3 bacterium GW2011_GWF2_35_18 TaxID=1618350 RepID=A0A0G0BHM0_UNCC3|nr:MAG: ATP-dependent DNA helicase PcrA [candidate division CPR3 bacterium GW2011_GWF2_35_18]
MILDSDLLHCFSTMDEILETLNSKQKEAVVKTEGPVLILAGPGSGKTRCITHRLAYLILQKHVNPAAILSITFTNKAANEMKIRTIKLLQEHNLKVKSLPWLGTFHASCVKILRREGKHLPYGSDFVIYDSKDQEETVKKSLLELHLDPKKFSPTNVLYTISSAKNELITAKEYVNHAHGYFQEIVAKVYPKYQSILRKNKALDFDDLIMETIFLFQEVPEVLHKYQNQFQYIQVDEYQDTNKSQYLLTKLLASNHHNICVVGDPGQGIYSWRGADIRNILEFEKDYPEVKVIKLEQNYRSTKTIISAAKQILEVNTDYPSMKLWTENFEGSRISIYEAYSEKDEALFLTDTIKSLLNYGENGEKLFQYSDFAVLYRTNAQSRILEEVLIREGVPYKLLGGVKFYERKEVKDVLAYLKFLANPADMIAWERIQKLGKRRSQKFIDWKEKSNLEKSSSAEILDSILKETGYLEYINNGSEEGISRVENVKELRSVAQSFDRLQDLLENIALIQDEVTPEGQKTDDQNNNSVVLMTLHSAKGLEFPIVFLAGCEEGLLPHSRAMTDKHELEEERRLCYVGITRAKQKLYMTYASKRQIFGAETFGAISRFIEDIDKDLLSWEQ